MLFFVIYDSKLNIFGVFGKSNLNTPPWGILLTKLSTDQSRSSLAGYLIIKAKHQLQL